jgi:hypothetical protein
VTAKTNQTWDTLDENDPIVKAIDLGGGQTVNIPGVFRELDKAGFVIQKRPYVPVTSDIQWDKPNGHCSQCGAPLNANYIGGYMLHGSRDRFAVSAACNMTVEQIQAAIETSEANADDLREYLRIRKKETP